MLSETAVQYFVRPQCKIPARYHLTLILSYYKQFYFCCRFRCNQAIKKPSHYNDHCTNIIFMFNVQVTLAKYNVNDIREGV